MESTARDPPVHTSSHITLKECWVRLERISSPTQAQQRAAAEVRNITGKTSKPQRLQQCSMCDKYIYGSGDLLRRHMAVHTGEKPFQCEYCGKCFVAVHRRNIHEKSCSQNPQAVKEIRPHQCKICGKDWLSTSNLRDHMSVHTGEKPFKCKLCEKSFLQRGHLRNHVIATHSNTKNYQCRRCDKKFSLPGIRRAHERIHDPEHDRDLLEKRKTWEQCPVCLVRVSYLKYHMLTHTGEKPYKCAQCDKRFTRKKHHANHLLAVHQKKKSYKCGQCNKSFSCAAYKLAHEKVHGKKQHLCQYCRKTFHTNKELVYHLRTHTGEKPHRCTHCESTFKTGSEKRAHENRHTSEKQFQCTFCKKYFKSNVSRWQHERLLHKRIGLQCKMCKRLCPDKPSLTRHERVHTDIRAHVRIAVRHIANSEE